MAARGGVGLDIDLSRVPLRESGMEPFEIMISESQERMAAIVEPAQLDVVVETCTRWQVDATPIGTVTGSGSLRAFHDGDLVGDIPVDSLVDGAPRYEVERRRPARLRDRPIEPRPAEHTQDSLLRVLRSTNIGSRRWIYRQYDQLVGSGTAVRPGGDAGVVRLTPSNRAVAISLDGNGRRTSLDPRRGGMSAVCEAARNVACTGAQPAAVTNCLNFGNPENPEVGYELAEAIEGMALACEALGLPVVSGNVSLYNENGGVSIPPTPVVGVVGVLDDAELAVASGFRQAGDIVLLLGDGQSSLDGSEYQKVILQEVEGRTPEPDLALELALHRLLAEAAGRGLLQSAHDVSDGGLAVAVCESAMLGGVGVETATLDDWFGEGDGRVVVSVQPDAVAELSSLAAAHNVPVRELGVAGGDQVVLGATAIPLAEARRAYDSALTEALGEEPI
jgi:phosphoribosylformylglycinamidine synthase